MKAVQVTLLALGILCGTAGMCFGDVQSNNSKWPAQDPANQAPAKNPQAAAQARSVETQEAPASKPLSQYPFGEPKITQQGDNWTALLPAKNFTIKSSWADKPDFNWQFGAEQQAQGAASLTSVKLPTDQATPPLLHAVIYIYDPKAADLDISNPDSIIDQLITAPTKEAEKLGVKIETKDLKGTAETKAGVVKDVRRQVAISKDDQGLESHFYRVLVGKDYVVLGLVIGNYDGLTSDAQNFFDSLSLEAKQ